MKFVSMAEKRRLEAQVRELLKKSHKCGCDLCVDEKIAKLTGDKELLARVKKIKDGA